MTKCEKFTTVITTTTVNGQNQKKLGSLIQIWLKLSLWTIYVLAWIAHPPPPPCPPFCSSGFMDGLDWQSSYMAFYSRHSREKYCLKITTNAQIARQHTPNVGSSLLIISTQCCSPVLAQWDFDHQSNVIPTMFITMLAQRGTNVHYYVGPTCNQCSLLCWPNVKPILITMLTSVEPILITMLASVEPM